MPRLIFAAPLLAGTLALAACADSSRQMSSDAEYIGVEGAALGPDGDATHDLSIAPYVGTGFSDDGWGRVPAEHDRARRAQRDEDRDRPSLRERGTSGDQRQGAEINGGTWADRSWHDGHVVRFGEFEMPISARLCLARASDGGQLSEVGHGMWDGKRAYCATVFKRGRPCRVVCDGQGNVLSMQRLD